MDAGRSFLADDPHGSKWCEQCVSKAGFRSPRFSTKFRSFAASPPAKEAESFDGLRPGEQSVLNVLSGAAGYTGPGSQASPGASALLIAATRRGGFSAVRFRSLARECVSGTSASGSIEPGLPSAYRAGPLRRRACFLTSTPVRSASTLIRHLRPRRTSTWTESANLSAGYTRQSFVQNSAV